MAKFSPKIEIINHFDNLINRIDIDIDSSLEKYNDEQLLSELLTSSENNRYKFIIKHYEFELNFFDEKTNDSSEIEPESVESVKVVDYLKTVRMKAIQELRKAQEDTLQCYKHNSSRFKSEQINIDELKSELFFAEKFYFQVNLKQSEKRLWAFNTFTFVTDFYVSQSDIDLLE